MLQILCHAADGPCRGEISITLCQKQVTRLVRFAGHFVSPPPHEASLTAAPSLPGVTQPDVAAARKDASAAAVAD
jgi:hypothetical protein